MKRLTMPITPLRLLAVAAALLGMTAPAFGRLDVPWFTVDGSATVAFPEHFTAVATAQGMTVQTTPHSADSKGLAVVERSIEGFVVRELFRGAGSYEFDYTVMAIRRGHEDYRVIRPSTEGLAAGDVEQQ